MASRFAFVASSLRAWHLAALTLAAACAHGADPLEMMDEDARPSVGSSGNGREGGAEMAGSAGDGVDGGSGGGAGSVEIADSGNGGSDETADGGGDVAGDATGDAPTTDARDAGKDSSAIDAGAPPKRPTGVVLGATAVASARQAPSAGGNTYSDECTQNFGDGGVGFGFQALVGFKGTIQTSVDGGAAPTNLRTVQGVCAPLSVSATAPYSVTVGTTNLLPLRGILPSPATAQTVTCPPNQVIVGFVGRQATFIEEMQFRCAPLAINGSTPSFTLELGTIDTTGPIGAATAGAAFTAIDCPANQIAVAQSPRAGGAIDSFGLVCRAPSLVIQ